MGIGAISAYRPYVYNTNSLTVNSLRPVSKISNDVSESRIRPEDVQMDNARETLNPLERGETSDFAGVLAMQMQMGIHNADLLFGAESVFAG